MALKLRAAALPLRALLPLSFLSAPLAAGAATRPVVMGSRGVVVAGHHAASDAGLTMLKNGGNAVDAGVAAVFAQAVTEFDRFGFGGEVPMLIYSAERGKVAAVSGQGQAPAILVLFNICEGTYLIHRARYPLQWQA